MTCSSSCIDAAEQNETLPGHRSKVFPERPAYKACLVTECSLELDVPNSNKVLFFVAPLRILNSNGT